jgi:hypothetical protein
MKHSIYHSLILDNTQVDYLMHGTAGINRMTCLFQLIEKLMAQIEKTPDVGECPEVLWQVNLSEVALSKLWNCDRKTVSKMLGKMKDLAILSSVQTRRGSVHTVLCISAWGIDGKKFNNPNYVPIHMRNACATDSKEKSTTNVAASSLSSGKVDAKYGDNAEIHNPISNDNIRCVDKRNDPDEAKLKPSSLSFYPDTIKPMEPEMATPDLESMKMEEEAQRHFAETEMEREQSATDGNPSSPSNLSQKNGVAAGCPISNEDDAHR